MNFPEALAWAEENKCAVPHFNVSDSTQLNSIAAIGKELSVPVIVGVSKGEETFIGRAQVAALVVALKKEGYSIFLNADHCHDVARACAAIDAGYDAVIIDGSALSFEDNVTQARGVVAYAKNSGRSVYVEGELGYIGTSSALLEEIPEGAGAQMTTAEDAARFVRETGVTLFSPSVGNIHGMLKHAKNPELDVDRVRLIAESIEVPLVLHGGSGISDANFVDAIQAGIRVVHINTEIRVAYREGIEAALAENLDEVAPYKYLGKGAEKMEHVVRARATLFTKNKHQN